MSASACGRSSTSVIAGRAELSLHEAVPVERARRAAIEAFLQFALQRFELRVLRDIAPHGFAHDLAGRAELARLDLPSGELDEVVAEGNRGVLGHADQYHIVVQAPICTCRD